MSVSKYFFINFDTQITELASFILPRSLLVYKNYIDLDVTTINEGYLFVLYYTYSFCFSRLLFTEESVLQHELGRGQLAFKWHKRSKPTAAVSSNSATALSSSTAEALGEQPASPKKDGEDTKDGSKGASKDETRPQASNGKIERKRIIFAIRALLRLIFF